MRTGRLFGFVAILVGAFTLASCSMLFPSQEGDVASSETPIANGTAPAGRTTDGATTSGPIGDAVETPAPGSTTTAVASANVEVTPKDVAVGNVTLTFAILPPRPMFEMAPSSAADSTQVEPEEKAPEPKKGSAVFPGGMLRVVNNIDPSQNPPGDSAEGIYRHIALQVKATESGQLLPYLDPTVDILLDGRPIIFDQALAPMVSVEGANRDLYYGNNIKFTRKGTYQVFVRMQPNPQLGADQPSAAQFNLTIR